MSTFRDFIDKEQDRYTSIYYQNLSNVVNLQGTIVMISTMRFTRGDNMHKLTMLANSTYGEDNVKKNMSNWLLKTPVATFVFVCLSDDMDNFKGINPDQIIFIKDSD